MGQEGGFREGSEREGEGEKEGQLAHEYAARSSFPVPTVCGHEWVQDLWMSGLAIDPKVKDITQAKTFPLFRCVKCGLLRLPIAEDATPPALL